MKKGKNLNMWLAISMFLLLTAYATAAGGTIYVDVDANGLNDGSSWTDAYNFLQDALAEADVSPKPVDICVAQGLYKPDQGVGITPGDRTAAFQLINGVSLKGGYAGFGEPDPNVRDFELYESILSGDLDGNDVDVNEPADLRDEPTRGENSYHVVTGSGTDETAVLDGLTITGGNANGSHWWDRCGGGMYNESGSPTIIQCSFSRNSANYGGALYNEESHPMLNNCTFRCNGGGGMFNMNDSQPAITNCGFSGNSTYGMYNYSNSGPTLANCTFSGNSSKGVINWLYSSPTLSDCIFSSNGGLGMYNGNSSNPILTNCTFNSNSDGGMLNTMSSNPTLTNCTFSGNWARTICRAGACSVGMGGGMLNDGGSPILINCTFSGNSADGIGGGMVNADSSPTLINCIFSSNLAGEAGGGMTNWQSSPTLINCIFSGNTADCGGGIYNEHNGNPTLTNCILWDNEALEGRQIALGAGYGGSGPSTITVSYCDVQGSAPGVFVDSGCTLNWCEGNIDTDPCFIQLGYWDVNGIWVDGDYHLLPDSPCIDTGDPNYTAEPNETDLDGKPRVIGGRIDMGAYEYEPSIPAEVRIVPRSINLANKGKWITCYIWLGEGYVVADIDPNSVFLEDEIEAESFRVDEQEQVAIAKFRRSEVQEMLELGDVELAVSGELSSGTRFEGTDTIRVIDKGGKNIEY